MNTSTNEISTRVKRLSRFCSNIYSKDIPITGAGGQNITQPLQLRIDHVPVQSAIIWNQHLLQEIH